MAWKIERGLDETFPGIDLALNALGRLSYRDLVIVASSSLDLALAELISRRLVDYPSEVEDFIGADEDGRAPVGSFGARIQCALLLGLIGPEDAAALRLLKNIRNQFAHRVDIQFTSEQVKKHLRPLWDLMTVQYRTAPRLADVYPDLAADLDREDAEKPRPKPNLRKELETEEKAGSIVVIMTFAYYTSRFYALGRVIQRVERLNPPG